MRFVCVAFLIASSCAPAYQRDSASRSGAVRDYAAVTHMMAWIAPPHFFRSGTLTVIYLGSNERVLAAPRGALGEQFAGAQQVKQP